MLYLSRGVRIASQLIETGEFSIKKEEEIERMNRGRFSLPSTYEIQTSIGKYLQGTKGSKENTGDDDDGNNANEYNGVENWITERLSGDIHAKPTVLCRQFPQSYGMSSSHPEPKKAITKVKARMKTRGLKNIT